MKNVNLQIRKLSKAGFSLVEMLVVIAVIGIIAAIAIPNIGNINAAARQSAAQRNAQTIASTFASAAAAGVTFAATDKASAVTEIAGGVSPADGAFKGKKFTVPNVPASGTERTELETYLNWNSSTSTLEYVGGNGVVAP
jgi:prepilin-type N-terminal cleavage/methylation domain-containing protein